MRLAILGLISVTLAGCAGHVADYIGPRSGIVTPQLIRFGMDLGQARCVGERLGGTLSPRQLRLFARAAGSVRQGYYDPARLGLRDLVWVAGTMRDAGVRRELDSAVGACGVAAAAAAPAPAQSGTAARPYPGQTVFRPERPAAAAADAPRRPAWLNLGAAGSGQSIAVDASSIEQQGARRSAWFRMTDPGASAPSGDVYLLHIDCTGRTINARARERRAADGAVAERVDYPDNPLTVEGGTVMEIAWLSMCT